MLVRLRHVRVHRRHDHDPVPERLAASDLLARVEHEADCQRTLERVLAIADEHELVAVRSIAEAWDDEAIRDRMGVSRATRNWRIRKLRDRAIRAGITL